MTTLQRTATAAEIATPRRQMGTISWKWMVTTDHKVIGNLYFITSMIFFLFGGILALAMRAELAWPGMQYLSYESFNQFFTMHGTIMLLLFATPLFAGFANAIMPLQIGANSRWAGRYRRPANTTVGLSCRAGRPGDLSGRLVSYAG